MSDIGDRFNEFIRDHADFTIAVLALTVLALCAVVWLWGRQSRHLRLLLAQERNANRAVLPAPSEAVMAAVASEAASRDLEQSTQPGNREVERSGRAMYTVAQRHEKTAEPAQPLARDSLGWTIPGAAADGGAAAPANAVAASGGPQEGQRDWALSRSDRRSSNSATEMTSGSAPSRGWSERTSAPAPEPMQWTPPPPSSEDKGSHSSTAARPALADAREQGVAPPAVANGTEASAPALDAHNAYVAWDAVTSPASGRAGGPTPGNGDAGAYVAWNRSIANPEKDAAGAEDSRASLHRDASFPELTTEVAAPIGGANGTSYAPAPDRAVTEPPHLQPVLPSATSSTPGDEAPHARPAAFAPWSVASEPAASPPPFSPGPPPGSWAPAPAVEPPSSNAAAAAPVPTRVAWTRPTQAPAAPSPDGGPGTTTAVDILLVEDDENVSKVYRLLLESRGYGVRTASDGAAGLDEARRQCPDLILLDVMMPRMNGILFMQALRSEPGFESLPVVILSNFKEPRLVERALALGALEYMVKAQTRPEALLNAVPHWVRHQRAFAG